MCARVTENTHNNKIEYVTLPSSKKKKKKERKGERKKRKENNI